MFNYKKICQELISDLPQKQKEVILRRFALSSEARGECGLKRETLESIGKSFGITRERVRQIEEAGLSKIKAKIENYQKVFEYFRDYLKKQGGLKKESILLMDLGGEKSQAEIYFLLTLSDDFQRFSEGEEFFAFWTIDKKFFEEAKRTIDFLFNKLKEIKKPLTLKELISLSSLKNSILASYLEISKKIQKNNEGFYGLKEWPEINPRGVKDKAYLVFKKVGKPLHFSKIAKLIEGGALVQTVHNELIRDPRFVLVGRGIYALSEWGYYPGQVKDVIKKILKETGPLTQKEILERVLKQRLVKESTVLLNLSNRKHFFKDSQGKYKIKEA